MTQQFHSEAHAQKTEEGLKRIHVHGGSQQHRHCSRGQKRPSCPSMMTEKQGALQARHG